MLDLETKGALSPAALETWTNAWLDEVGARTGVAALVYTSPNFWKTGLAETQSVATAGHPLWVAHWTSNAAPLVPAADWAGQSWTFWQWTDCVKVPGFAHCSDGDRYRGADPVAVAIPAYPSGPPAGSSPPTIVGVAQTGKTLAGIYELKGEKLVLCLEADGKADKRPAKFEAPEMVRAMLLTYKRQK